MQFQNINEFLAMGGYGFYVWLAFGISFILIMLLLLSSKSSHKNTLKQLAIKHKREAKLKQAAEQQKLCSIEDSK